MFICLLMFQLSEKHFHDELFGSKILFKKKKKSLFSFHMQKFKKNTKKSEKPSKTVDILSKIQNYLNLSLIVFQNNKKSK